MLTDLFFFYFDVAEVQLVRVFSLPLWHETKDASAF